jgi:hypothetical protein
VMHCGMRFNAARIDAIAWLVAPVPQTQSTQQTQSTP